MTGKLVKAAQDACVVLRQSYVRVTKHALVKQVRYAKARQMNRARKCQKKLHTNLGRLTRDISRKLEGNPDAGKRQNLRELLVMADRLLQQTKTTSPKLYSLHEPDVECIAKGEAPQEIRIWQQGESCGHQRAQLDCWGGGAPWESL